YFAYVRLRSRETSGPAQTSIVQMTPPAQSSSVTSSETINPPTAAEAKEPTPNQSSSQSPRRTNNERSTTAKASPGAAAPAQPRDENADDVTRSGAVVPNLKLSEVKKVYIEIRGDGAFNELRSKLVEGLESSGVIAPAANADEADAALKIVVSQTS